LQVVQTNKTWRDSGAAGLELGALADAIGDPDGRSDTEMDEREGAICTSQKWRKGHGDDHRRAF